MSKKMLMVAYHYPPCSGSSGLQRTLNFTRHLPEHGWDPLLLSIHPRAYLARSDDQLGDIPSGMPVERAFALDSARDLAIKGRYFSWTALPDRWISWPLWAIPAGLKMIRKYRPEVVWSTYPIASSLWIGYALHKLSGLPWVVDIRDPLTEDDPRTGERSPADYGLWRTRRAIEERAMSQSTRVVLVTEGARNIYANRYGKLPKDHWAVIPNGYSEESFAEVERSLVLSPRKAGPLQLLHSGLLYPGPDRDPCAFFAALAGMRESGKLAPEQVQVTLRASGFEDRYRAQIQEHGLQDIVHLAPPIAYRDALAEMLSADGLLVFQGYTSNPAVPAKLYEYLRARRPIFALVDEEGDTALTLRATGAGTIVPLDSVEIISKGLATFLEALRLDTAAVADDGVVRQYARESRAYDLAMLLNEVAG